jgi:hypothetical protein
MDKIPAEVFCSVVTGAVVWFFKEKEKDSELKRRSKCRME